VEPRFDRSTALIVVDVQNDFADPGGGLYVAGGHEVVAVVNELVGEARRSGALVVYTQDWHPTATPHFAKDGGTWPVHCVMGSWGARLHPDLELAGEVVRKGSGGEDGYSGFSVRDAGSGEVHPTALGDLLAAHGIARVVVVGLATDYCVKETALDALRRGFETIVVVDATRPVNLQPVDGDRALEEMAEAGARIE
jgi:nicotinamidase/pyrazinamidase